MKPLISNIMNSICNYNKLVLILYTILVINLCYAPPAFTAPTTNSPPPSKLSPSSNQQQSNEKSNFDSLLLGDPATEQPHHNADSFDEFEISTTTNIPLEVTKNDVSISVIPTTTNSAASNDQKPSEAERANDARITTTAATHLNEAKTIQKPKKFKNRQKIVKEKVAKLMESMKPTVSSASAENPKKVTEHKSPNQAPTKPTVTTTAATIVAATTVTDESLEIKTQAAKLSETSTNDEPIVVDYLTTTEPNPFDELLNLNDHKVEEALSLAKKDAFPNEKPSSMEVATATTTETPATTKIETATESAAPVGEKQKQFNAHEDKKTKLFEAKKSHISYKKKLRQKLRQYNNSKMIENKKTDSQPTTKPKPSTSIPILSTTNDISNPILLPATHETSAQLSTSSADPLSKLNTKTVNPFRHQEAIDDISVSDTVSATTLETTTVETPVAMASATSTQQTTVADNVQLSGNKQISMASSTSAASTDNTMSKYSSESQDELSTTQSHKSQSPLPTTESSTSSQTASSEAETNTKVQTDKVEDKLSLHDTTTKPNNSIDITQLSQETENTAAPADISSNTKEATTKPIALSDVLPFIKTTSAPLASEQPLETSSSPTTFMAQDQLKYTDDDGGNFELVTTKFITDLPRVEVKSQTTIKASHTTLSAPAKSEKSNLRPDAKSFSTTTTTTTAATAETSIASQLSYDHKNKNTNPKKLNDKGASVGSETNKEINNFNSIVQSKDVAAHKLLPSESSTPTSVRTGEKTTKFPIINMSPTTTTTTTFPVSSTQASSLYSSLKDTFRAVHTTTGSVMAEDISILDAGLESSTVAKATSYIQSTTETVDTDQTSVDAIGENNEENKSTKSSTETLNVVTEKLIKLTDVEDIDLLDLIKLEALTGSSKNVSEILINPKQNSGEKNSTLSQPSIGHDGLKATKKKQLKEKHFNTDSVAEHKLGPLRMKETVLHPAAKEIRPVSIATSSLNPDTDITETKSESVNPTDPFEATKSLNIESSTSYKTSYTETDNEPTVMLDIDLISENSQPDETTFDQVLPKIESTPTTRTKTTTESEYIRHKNFEKSLIPKLEWVPIASVEHIDITDGGQSTSTIESSYATYESSNRKSDQLATGDSQTKSLEIELVEPTKSDNSESRPVPEFFEISKPMSGQQVQSNDKENSESSPIEIQINVSEGFGNENENLEFSFRQIPSEKAFKPIKVAHTMQNPPPGFQEIGEITIQRSPENQSADGVTMRSVVSMANNSFIRPGNHEYQYNKSQDAEEILQVEITAIDNSTGIESFNEPKFILQRESNSNKNRENDDFFIPDLKLESTDELKEQNRQLDGFSKDNLDRDSDTIFYISNTEVKVAESKPTPNSVYRSDIETISDYYHRRNKTAAEINRSKLESQFFPTIYEEDVRIGVSKSKNSTASAKPQFDSDRYEEDIILSPLKSNFDPMKIDAAAQQQKNVDSAAAAALTSISSDTLYPLSSSAADVSYVGETLIEIEESTNANPAIPPLDLITFAPAPLPGDGITTTKKGDNVPAGMIIGGERVALDDTNSENASGAMLSDVIIQPAVIPEMSIGVPVIGELPPQIELKEIDYIPNSVNTGDKNQQQQQPDQQQQQQQQTSSDQIDGGAIQYGGDLISDDDTSGGAGSRYVFESAYPFGDERIRKVGRLRNEQNFDNDASDIDDNDSISSSRDDDGFSNGRRNLNKMYTNTADILGSSSNINDAMSQQQIVMHAINNNFQKEQFMADFPSYETLKEVPQKRGDSALKENSDSASANSSSSSSLASESSASSAQDMVNATTVETLLGNVYNTTTIGQLMANGSGNSTEPEQLGNATAFIIMDDAEGNVFDLTDIQTLLIACFATLIPLVLSLLLAFAVRYLWKKYHRDDDPDEEGGLVGDTSIDPMAAKSSALSQDELRTTDSGYTFNRSNDTLDTNATDLDGVANGNAGLNGGKMMMANHCGGGGGSHTVANNNINNTNSCVANGSVITMTLKNNHLIVETEERNDISRDARETKMHYNSSDKDGVFVVEVQRGADTTGVPNSPYKENHIGQKQCSLDVGDKAKLSECKTSGKNHEEVQIHQPPADNFNSDGIAIAKSATISELDEAAFEFEERGINLGNSKTGLSQSDLSSSSNDSNKGYNYGKQELYTTNMKSYNSTSPKQKVSSGSLDSVKDKSENGFNGDNCDTESSPHSRECYNGMDIDDKKTNPKSDKFSKTRNANNANGNSNECDSIGTTTTAITSENDKSDKENKKTTNYVDSSEQMKQKENNGLPEQNTDITVGHRNNESENEKNCEIENELMNKIETTNTITAEESKTERTIEIDDSLPPPPPPPQFNEEIVTTTHMIATNQHNGHAEENQIIASDITNSSSSPNRTTAENQQPAAVAATLGTKQYDGKEVEKQNDDKQHNKIIHHENGLNDHHHQNQNNHEEKQRPQQQQQQHETNSTNLTNGHYEKQNGIIHNDDNDCNNGSSNGHDDIDVNNDATTNDSNDVKKLNGLPDTDTDTDRITEAVPTILSTSSPMMMTMMANHENGFDSILSLPDPPSTEEIKQMNDIILMENSQLDSLPPPPPLDIINSTTAPAGQTATKQNHADESIGHCNDELIKTAITNGSGNCGIDSTNINDIKILLNGGDHHDALTTLTDAQQQQQQQQQIHQNGICGGANAATTLVAVNGSS